MKTKIIGILLLLSACAGGVQEYPKNSEQMRVESRSDAYNKAVGQSLNKQGISGQDCYYRMSGCSDAVKNQPAGQESKGYDVPLNYPKQGYELKADGLYHYKPGAMSRR